MRSNIQDAGGKEGDDITDASSTTTSSSSDSSDLLSLNAAGRGSGDTTVTQLKSENLQALFVNDLAYDVTEEDLVTLFAEYPGFVSAKVCLNSITNKSLGHGYLNFSNKDDAKLATKELNYIPLKGKEIRIMPSMRKIDFKRNIGRNVFFSNLPSEHQYFTTRFFSDSFEHCGDILSCRLYKDKKIGFIHFMKEEDAQRCVSEYNGYIWLKNRIYCRIHHPEARIDGSTVINAKVSQKRRDEIPKGELPAAETTGKLGPTKCLGILTSHGGHYRTGEINKLKFKSLESRDDNSDICTTEEDNNEGEHVKNGPRDNKNNTVLLSNLSILCNEKFLKELCHQQGIFATKMRFLPYNKETMSQSCIIECKSRTHAQLLYNFLDDRFIGGNTVKVSWVHTQKKEKKKEYHKGNAYLFQYIGTDPNINLYNKNFDPLKGRQLQFGTYNEYTGGRRGYT